MRYCPNHILALSFYFGAFGSVRAFLQEIKISRYVQVCLVTWALSWPLKYGFLNTVICYRSYILLESSLYIPQPSCKVWGLNSLWFLGYFLLHFERFGPDQVPYPEAEPLKINFSGLWCATKLVFCRIKDFAYLNHPAKFEVWTPCGSWDTSSCWGQNLQWPNIPRHTWKNSKKIISQDCDVLQSSNFAG